jgi:hypothetical protein
MNPGDSIRTMAIWSLKYILAADFSIPCRTEDELAQRVCKNRFYGYCMGWMHRLPRAKDDEITNLVYMFLFHSPGQGRTHRQMANLHKVFEPPIGIGEYDSQLSINLFVGVVEGPTVSWIIISILEKHFELLNVDLLGIGLPSCRDTLLALHRPYLSAHLYIAPVHRFVIHEVAQYFEDWDSTLHPFFLRNRALVNLEDNDGATPLDYAALCDNISIVQLLINAGANINAKTKTGKTVLHVALSTGSVRVLAYLVLPDAQIPMDAIPSLSSLFKSLCNGGCTFKFRHLPELEQLQSIKEFIDSQEISVFHDSSRVGDYPIGWKSLSFSCHRRKDFQFSSSEGYVSGQLRGTRLKRAEFRISSSFEYFGYVSQKPQMRLELIIENSIGYSNLQSDLKDPYRHSYTWFEVAVIKHATESLDASLADAGMGHESAVAHRYIDTNPDSRGYYRLPILPIYHYVSLDIRRPAPGAQEWLESIQTGDLVVVYPRAIEGYANVVWSIEMTLYWED